MAEASDDSLARVGYIFHYISEKDLKPGDHIYCYRLGLAYTHHGIYIGERGCEVIHVVDRTVTSNDSSFKSLAKLSNSTQKYKDEKTLQEKLAKLRNERGSSYEIGKITNELKKLREIRVESATLAEFCNGDWVRLVAYNCTNPFKTNQSKHMVKAMPPKETIKLAKHFLDHPEEWPQFHIIEWNCEKFACFCKTGLLNIATQLHPLRLWFTEVLDEPYPTAEKALREYEKQRTFF